VADVFETLSANVTGVRGGSDATSAERFGLRLRASSHEAEQNNNEYGLCGRDSGLQRIVK